jgi:hypothetical protein
VAKNPSPLLGYNNNVKHKGKVYHIQTEDSGVRHPHVITHLFTDGGRIVKSTKTSYSEHVGVANMTEVVRNLMKEQHKAMFIALRDGQFDEPTPSAEVEVPPEEKPAVVNGSAKPTASEPNSPTLPAIVVEKAGAPAPPSVKVVPFPNQRSISPTALTQEHPSPPKRSKSQSNARKVEGENNEVSVDPNVIQRAAMASSKQPSPMLPPRNSQLPPPPEAVLSPKRAEGSSYRSVVPPKTNHNRESSGKYAVSRPASIFASTARAPEGRSIFGEELISEKSLDEVILSYLAEDLDSSAKK